MSEAIEITVLRTKGNLVKYERDNEGCRVKLDTPYRNAMTHAKFTLPNGKKKMEVFSIHTPAQHIVWEVQRKYSNFKFKIRPDWIPASQPPPYGEEVEVSFDGGKTVECTAQFSENCTCMMAGIAGGYGYFTDMFATVEDNLVLRDVTHWRPLEWLPGESEVLHSDQKNNTRGAI